MPEPPDPRSPAPPDHRGAARVRCRMPARVVAPADWPPAHVLDLSRTGVRLGVQVADSDPGEDPSLGALTEALHDHLATKVVIDLNPDRLGSLVRRSLRIVRVGPHREEDALLELGCELVPALSDEEAEALGLPLPRPGEPPDIARRRMAAEPPRPRTPGQPPPGRAVDHGRSWGAAARVPRPGVGRRAPLRLGATVLSRDRAAGRALHGSPLEFSPQGGFLAVEDRDAEPLFCPTAPLTDRVIAFSKAYGSVVDVIVDDESGRSLWYGPVRVVSVGVIPEVPGSLILGFTFRRPLDSWEQEALGIVAA